MVVGNRYGDYHLACIVCGKTGDLALVAHRNASEKVVGYVVVCEGHLKQATDGYTSITITREVMPMAEADAARAGKEVVPISR